MTTTEKNPESTQFGQRTVSPEEKTSLVHNVFDHVANKYDLMNDLMSGGIHRLWKDRFIREIRPRPGLQYLDVAGGTGDIAFRIHKWLDDWKNRKIQSSDYLKAQTSITLCDLTHHMLTTGRDRAIDKGCLDDFEWVTGNAENLPFEGKSFDVYTISFGLRNVTHIDDALKEAWRVLKPGGQFFCLEFSRVRNPLLAKAYDLYSFQVIPRLGECVARDRESYQYLVESIRNFPDQKQLVKRLLQAGFQKADFINLSGGIACIHKAIRI